MHLPRILVLVLAFICLTFAATSLHAQTERPRPSRSDEQRIPKVEQKADRPPTVTLLEPGDSPRRELRYAIEPGLSQTIVLTVQSAVQQTAAGITVPPVRIPELRFTVQSTVRDVNENSEISARMTFLDAEVVREPGIPPHIENMMRQTVNAMKGRSVEIALTPRGIIRSMNIDVPPGRGMMAGDPSESIRQSIIDALIVLPEPAVGDGARWQVETTVDVNNFTAKQRSVYTITRMEENTVELMVEVTQTAEPQPLQIPGMQQVNLKTYKGEGMGPITLALGSLLPKKSERTSVAEMEMEIVGPGGSQRMTQKTDARTTISPAKKNEEEGEADHTREPGRSR